MRHPTATGHSDGGRIASGYSQASPILVFYPKTLPAMWQSGARYSSGLSSLSLSLSATQWHLLFLRARDGRGTGCWMACRRPPGVPISWKVVCVVCTEWLTVCLHALRAVTHSWAMLKGRSCIHNAISNARPSSSEHRFQCIVNTWLTDRPTPHTNDFLSLRLHSSVSLTGSLWPAVKLIHRSVLLCNTRVTEEHLRFARPISLFLSP